MADEAYAVDHRSAMVDFAENGVVFKKVTRSLNRLLRSAPLARSFAPLHSAPLRSAPLTRSVANATLARSLRSAPLRSAPLRSLARSLRAAPLTRSLTRGKV